MKTILVTGAAGYIGRHVVKNALDRGYRVIAADFNFKGVDERAEFCDEPLFSGDPDLYRKLGSPDICIHLAWRDGFRHNSAAHMKDLSSHVTFLNTLVEGGLQGLSVMGTMHEVGYWEGAINESTPCKPQSQYGIAKNALRQSGDNPRLQTLYEEFLDAPGKPRAHMLLHTTYVCRNAAGLPQPNPDVINGPLGESHPKKL